MVAEYTTQVTGEDLYNLLGKTAIDDNTLFVYVDGEDENLGDAAFGKADMVKKNDETIGRTGNGVLTQVFLDTQDDEITVAIINTYLAKRRGLRREERRRGPGCLLCGQQRHQPQARLHEDR